MNSLEGIRLPRRLTGHGGSVVVAIPKKMVRHLGWHIGNYVSVRLEGSKVVIEWTHLNQDSEANNKHNPVPNGKHGERFRRENEEAAAMAGALKPGTKPPG